MQYYLKGLMRQLKWTEGSEDGRTDGATTKLYAIDQGREDVGWRKT